MQTNIQEAEKLIKDLSVGEDVKSALLARLSKEGVTEDLIVDIQVAIAEAQAKVHQQYKPIVEKLEALAKAEDQALNQAHQQYEEQMDQIDAGEDAFYQAVSTQIDQQKIEVARQKIKQKTV